MKKAIIFLLALALMLGVSWCAQAGVYVESMVGGSWEAEGEDGDVSATIVGFDYKFNAIKFGAEYISGTWKDFPWYGDIDFSAYEVKLGYDFIDGDKTDLYGIISYFKYEYDDLTTDANGILLGAEFDHYFNDSSLLEASIGFSVDGEINYPHYTHDADVFLAKLRYNYFFTDNFGLNLGYRYYKVTDGDSDGEFISKGFTAGLSFKF